MEFKKTPLQNLKDILEAVDSQASAKSVPHPLKDENSSRESSEEASFEDELVCRVDHVQKYDILLKIKEIKEIPRNDISAEDAYLLLRGLWQEGLLESDIF